MMVNAGNLNRGNSNIINVALNKALPGIACFINYHLVFYADEWFEFLCGTDLDTFPTAIVTSRGDRASIEDEG